MTRSRSSSKNNSTAMPRPIGELESQFAESAKLEAAVRTNFEGLNFKL